MRKTKARKQSERLRRKKQERGRSRSACEEKNKSAGAVGALATDKT